MWTQLRAAVPVRTGILALDERVPEAGQAFGRVQRQYCGALGKIGNCQVAVSSALLAAGGPWPLTFELYLPQSWMADPTGAARRRHSRRLAFREKGRIALAHIRTVLQAGFQLDGVAVDADYGSNAAFRAALERLGLRYGVAIRGDLAMGTSEARRAYPASVMADAVPAADWQTVTWGTGTKGPLTADFLAVRARPTKSRGERWLLCERRPADGARKYYLLNLDATASLRALVALARRHVDQAPSSCPSRSGSPCRRHRPARRHAPPPRHWRSATCNCRP